MRARQLTTIFRTIGLVLLVLGTLGLPAGAEVRGDFNGDGYADLAIGVPNDSVSSVHGAGVVNVLYGEPGTGLTAIGDADTPDDQIWHQDVTGIAETAEKDEGFGSELATGDFDGDGFADLAIGVFNESVDDEFERAGAVNVIYGSAAGLTATGSQIWHQDSTGILDEAEDDDLFGYALATGDFNHDGYDDLAVGVPGEDLRSGAAQVIYGTAAGLAAAGNQLWSQDSAGILDVAESADEFGYALAAGDYNGDGISDLAVGVWGEDLNDMDGSATNDILDAGAVNVLYSDWDGLTSVGNQLWHQDVPSIRGKAERSDRFGATLASGDFNGDNYSDLAIGVLNEGLVKVLNVGSINVIYGFHEGLDVAKNRVWHQDAAGILERAEDGDQFAVSLAAGDFDGDGYDDLAIGVAHETVGGGKKIAAGAVNVLYGRFHKGLAAGRNQFWQQGRDGVTGRIENWDQFGASLAAGDFNGDGYCDLAIGVFNEGIADLNGGGAVNVLYGAEDDGLTGVGDQVWHQNTAGVDGKVEIFDWFGFALASGY